VSRRLRIWLTLLAGLGLFVALLATAGWLALQAYGPQLAVERVTEALTRALHRPVRVERVRVRLLPPRLDLYGILAEGTPGAPPFLQLAHARAGLALASLWRGRLMLAVLLEDGSLALGPAPPAGPSAAPLTIPETVTAGRLTLGIQEVRLARIDLRDTDPRQRSDLEIRGLAGTGQPTHGGLELDLQAATVRFTDPDLQETVDQVEGVGSLQGDLLRIRRLAGVWLGHRVTARGEIRDVASRPDLRLHLEGPVDLGRLAGRYTRVTIQGQAQAALEVRGPFSALEVSGQVRAPALGVWALQGRDVLAEGRWAARRLTLSRLETRLWAGRLRGSLELAPDRLAETRAEIQLQEVAIEELASLLPAIPAGLRGRLTLQGAAQGDPRRPENLAGPFTLSATRVELPGPLGRLGPGSLEAVGTLARRTVELSRAEGRWPALSLQARGGMTEAGPRALAVVLEGDLAVLGRFLPQRDLAGQATLRADLGGRWGQPEATGVLEMPQLTALQTTLQQVRLPFHFAGNVLEVTKAGAVLGQTPLLASGTARLPAGWAPADGVGAVRFRVDLQAPALRLADLERWVPPAWRGVGTVALQAGLEGTPQAWQGAGRLEARELLAPRGIPIRGLAAAFRLDPSSLEVPRLTAAVQGIPVAAQGRYDFAGSGEARASLGPADLARLPGLPPRPALGGTLEGQVQATLRGGLVEAQGEVRGRGLTAAGLALGEGSARATLRGSRLEASLALPGGGLTATLRGPLDASASLDAEVAVRGLDVRPLLQAVRQRGNLDLYGSVSAHATLAIPMADPAALRARASLDPVALTISGDAWTNQGPVVLRWEAAALHVDRLLLKSRVGSLEARGSIQQAGRLDLVVDGQVPLAILPALRPELREARGLLSVSATLAGTLAAPDLRGEGTIRDGLFQLASYPDPFREVQASFTASRAGIQLKTATATLGRGRLQASGTLVLRGSALGPYQARISGRDVAASPLPGLQTAWNTDLEIVGQGDRAQITGQAQLQRGSYTQDLSPLTLLAPKGGGGAPSPGASGIFVKVLVTLPNPLVVQTGQARLRVGGSLSLEGRLPSPVAFGILDANNGQIQFRDHTFTVVSARARFDDPRRIDPFLDVEATSQIRTYNVTIRLTGRSENLNVRFSSIPPLPSEDLLTLVTFGVTREEFAKSAGGIALGEAAQLVVQDLLGVRPGAAGFDVGVQRSQTGTSVLSVGREVAPRTKLIYKQELTGERQQRLRVEYQLIGPLLLAGEETLRGGYGADLVLRLRFR
jgi:autotransporter translocation and assembly factor TamB